MSFAVASTTAAAFSAKASKSIRGSKNATRTTARRASAAPTARAMTVNASSATLLADGDKKPLVDSVETFIFDCDGKGLHAFCTTLFCTVIKTHQATTAGMFHPCNQSDTPGVTTLRAGVIWKGDSLIEGRGLTVVHFLGCLN
jgi:hypothetical protein